MKHLIVTEEKIILQEAPYIEHGCYIEILGSEITLYEIPYGGGEQIEIGKFDTLIQAIKHSKTLT